MGLRPWEFWSYRWSEWVYAVRGFRARLDRDRLLIASQTAALLNPHRKRYAPPITAEQLLKGEKEETPDVALPRDTATRRRAKTEFQLIVQEARRRRERILSERQEEEETRHGGDPGAPGPDRR